MFWIHWLPFALFCAGTQPFPPLLDAEDNRRVDAPILQTYTTSKEPKKRVRAAMTWGRMQHPKAVPPLLKLAQDTSYTVQSAALFSLGHLGWEERFHAGYRQNIIRVVRTHLHSKSVQVQKRALEALAIYAPRSIFSILTPILERDFNVLQAEALRTLFRAHIRLRRRASRVSKPTSQPHQKRSKTRATSRKVKKNSRIVLPSHLVRRLHQLAYSPNTLTRRNVAYYYARVPDPRGYKTLTLLAHDPNVWVCYFALVGLKKQKNSDSFSVAHSVLQHPSWSIRTAALQLLKAIKRVDKLPSGLRNDPSFHVRTALAQAYALGSKQVLSVLHSMWLHDRSFTVRVTALNSLVKLLIRLKREKQAIQYIQAALQAKNWLIREAAVHASKAVPHKRLNWLISALRDKHIQVRAASLQQLAKHKGKVAFTALQRALKSKALLVRGTALFGLAKRTEKSTPELLWKAYLNCSHSRWIELREWLVHQWAKRVTSRTTRQLKKALSDPAPSVAHAAYKALRKRGFSKTLHLPKPTFTHSPHRQLVSQLAPSTVIVLVTNKGAMEVTSVLKHAPIHVANFVGRVQKGLYDGLIWHRVISNFVIQGGDPDGTGWGDGGYQIRSEINRLRYVRGVLGMPRAQGWNTGSVQLFFTHTPTPHLDGRYTVFGRITKGLDVMDKIERGDRILRAYVQTSVRRPTSRPILQK